MHSAEKFCHAILEARMVLGLPIRRAELIELAGVSTNTASLALRAFRIANKDKLTISTFNTLAPKDGARFSMREPTAHQVLGVADYLKTL